MKEIRIRSLRSVLTAAERWAVTQLEEISYERIITDTHLRKALTSLEKKKLVCVRPNAQRGGFFNIDLTELGISLITIINKDDSWGALRNESDATRLD